MKFNIRAKLLLGFLAVIVLLIVISLVSISKMKNLGDNSMEIDSRWMPSVTILGTLNGDVSDVERLSLNIIVERDPAEMEKVQAEYDKVLKKVESGRKTYEKLIATPKEREMYEDFSKKYAAYLEKLPEVIAAGKANDYVQSSILHKESYVLWYSANDTINQLIKLNADGSKQITQEAVDNFISGRQIVIILSIAAVLLALIMAVIIAQIISKPILRISRAAESIASGDLTGEAIIVKGRDEISTLALSFNTMVENLRQLIQSVSKTTEMVTTSSEELTASAEQNSQASAQITETVQEVATGTGNQVDMVTKSSQAIEEMSIGVEQIAIRAQNVFASAQDAAHKSAEGNQMIQQAVTQMNAVNDSMNSLAGLMAGLGERSDEIGKIIDVITNISSQTNLLALNAAIEAARAGEHGRGFAVVAGEVRKLAEQSAHSAQQITELVGLIQKDTAHAIEAVAANGQDVMTGREVVQNAGASFELIQETVNKVASEIEEVSAGSEQMSASTDEIVGFVKQISAIAEEAAAGTQHVSAATQEQLASMEEIASSARNLSTMAEDLQGQIGKFKV
ncbi:methyl-accepting chemotaxis protein [Paenibacillus sp. Aloe-11]|uniref:methyl-accepting chemotaxis protein n=1 Tax=Paenibacillus sp. Aloe-11 TaxID=1050222 RepID=UPI00024EFD9C|nr:methyl-accepting chemotaxis protein [Paenibacillus sp. Aloe-11]EHS56650.1 methyl-accepting chemotaxis protein [Paenibacillus sp. Aloe-11]